MISYFRENFISFTFQGADYVEFDVMLSKDLIPVIYHDFHVLITYRKVKHGTLNHKGGGGV